MKNEKCESCLHYDDEYDYAYDTCRVNADGCINIAGKCPAYEKDERDAYLFFEDTETLCEVCRLDVGMRVSRFKDEAWICNGCEEERVAHAEEALCTECDEMPGVMNSEYEYDNTWICAECEWKREREREADVRSEAIRGRYQRKYGMAWKQFDGVKFSAEDKIWCGMCDSNVPVGSLIFWNNDGECDVLLCPGCNSELIELAEDWWKEANF